jgi:hypothetical protein
MRSIRQNASGLGPHTGCEKKADKPDQPDLSQPDPFEIFALHCILYAFDQNESNSLKNKQAVIETLDLKLIKGKGMETYELLEDDKVCVVRLEEAPCPVCGAGGVLPCESDKCDPEHFCW